MELTHLSARPAFTMASEAISCHLLKATALILLACSIVLHGCGGGSNSSSPPAAGSANLTALELEGFQLDQIFQPDQPDYTAEVGFLVTSVKLRAEPSQGGSGILIDGAVFAEDVELHLAEGANQFSIEVNSASGSSPSIYSLTITRAIASSFAERAYIKAANPFASDRFSYVALSGDTLVVGATGEDGNGTAMPDNSALGSGAVYVFTRDGAGLWSQQAYLKASNLSTGDAFGRSVAIDGDTLAVGANRARGTLVEPDNTRAPRSGSVYVFTRDETGAWTEQAFLKSSNADGGDNFGLAIALEGNTLVVGAQGEASDGSGPLDNSAEFSGAVYVFTRDESGIWSEQAYLKANNADAFDDFGSSVALLGDTLAVGAASESGDGPITPDNGQAFSGAAYVFVRDSAGLWSQEAYLKASNPGTNDFFGYSIALSQGILAVGAFGESNNGSGPENNDGGSAGAVYIFGKDQTGVWTEQAYLKPSPVGNGDQFGISVALVGNTLAVGASTEGSNGAGPGDNSAFRSGAAYVFARDSTGEWAQQAFLKASNIDRDDRFGESVALSGQYLVVGASDEQSDGSSPQSNSANDAGAVYVFE